MPRTLRSAAAGSAPAPRHIFFYGTLMRGFPLRERAGIDGWIRLAGCGEVTGALFDLGFYPGLTEADGRVRGEVYELVAADPLLARADAIEHFERTDPAASEYVRRAVACRLDDGRTLDAWTYFYNRSVAAARTRAGRRLPPARRAAGPCGGFVMIWVLRVPTGTAQALHGLRNHRRRRLRTHGLGHRAGVGAGRLPHDRTRGGRRDGRRRHRPDRVVPCGRRRAGQDRGRGPGQGPGQSERHQPASKTWRRAT